MHVNVPIPFLRSRVSRPFFAAAFFVIRPLGGTCQDLPIDEPYEQLEGDFERDEEGKEDSPVA